MKSGSNCQTLSFQLKHTGLVMCLCVILPMILVTKIPLTLLILRSCPHWTETWQNQHEQLGHKFCKSRSGAKFEHLLCKICTNWQRCSRDGKMSLTSTTSTRWPVQTVPNDQQLLCRCSLPAVQHLLHHVRPLDQINLFLNDSAFFFSTSLQASFQISSGNMFFRIIYFVHLLWPS